jgi:mannosyltransferase
MKLPRATPGWRGSLALVAILAAALRVHEIGRRSVWFDEGLTLGAVEVPLGELLAHATNPTLNNQILYYLALRPWQLFGGDIEVVRAFSALASVAAVVVTALLGRRLFGTVAGLAGGTLLAVHWFAIRYAQEARGYSLAMLCSCVAALMLARAVESRRRGDVAGWVAASALAPYAHSFAMFTVVSLVASLAVLGPRVLRQRRDLVAGAAAIGILLLPMALSLAGASQNLIGWIPPVTPESALRQLDFLSGGTATLAYVYAFVLGVLLVRIVRATDATDRWACALVIAWAIGPLIVLVAVSLLKSPVLLNRYLVMSIPAWTLAAGAAAATIAQRRALVPVAFVLAAIPLAFELRSLPYVYRDPYEDWREPAKAIASDRKPGDAILYESSWSAFALEYYLDRLGGRPERVQKNELLFSNEFDPAEATSKSRIWLVLSRENRVRGIRMEGLLEEAYPTVSSKYAGDVRVILYER